MAKLKKGMLDIGPGAEQVGLNILEDTEKRRLFRNSPQSFKGDKTFQTPPRCGAYPLSGSDAVPKYALLERVKCANFTVTETLEITEQNIADGFIALKRRVVSPQAFEIVQLDGAPGLVFEEDFSVEPDVDGTGRLVWENFPLGAPGKIMAGDHLIVRYNACRPSVVTEPTLDRVFAARIKREEGGDYTILGTLTHADSEKEFELVRYSDNSVIKVKLPVIPEGAKLLSRSLNGKLLLYTTPTMLPPVKIEQQEGVGIHAYYRERIVYPFFSDAFRIYEYDFNLKIWQLKLTEDFSDLREQLKGQELWSDTEYPHKYSKCDIEAMRDGGVALFISWMKHVGRDDWSEPTQSFIACKRYDENYALVGSDIVCSPIIEAMSPFLYEKMYVDKNNFVPSFLGNIRFS